MIVTYRTAIATLISQICQAVLSLGLTVLSRSPILPQTGTPLGMDAAFFKKYIKVCLPVILNEGLWGLGNSCYAMVLARQGSDNYAAYAIFNNVTELVFVFFVGVCSACGIMLGHEVGAGDLEAGYRTGKRAMILTPVLGAVLGIGVMVLKGPLLQVFPMEKEREEREAVSKEPSLGNQWRLAAEDFLGRFTAFSAPWVSGQPSERLSVILINKPMN